MGVDWSETEEERNVLSLNDYNEVAKEEDDSLKYWLCDVS